MRAEDLYRLMEEPSELTEGTLLELRRIVEDYPYFQVARMLYLKNLAVLNDMSFTLELEKMAIFLPDRKKLFQLIEGDKYGLNSRVEHEPDMRKEDTFSLIDAFLSNRNEEPEPKKEASFLFQPSVSSDYMFWSLSKEEEEKPSGEDAENRLRHHDLIDSFIKNDQQRMPGSGLEIREETSRAETPESVKDLDDEQSKSLEDSCLTETLARIYIKQKRYDKALQIIKNLSLKYPEKNVYFAHQIRFLEKLISILILIASILLILIVLIQNSKGGGLASGFSSSNQIMGVRKTTDFLEKATWSLAGAVIVLSIVITAFIPRTEHAAQSEIKQQVNDAVSIDPNTIAPDFGTAQQPAVPAEETPATTPAEESNR